MKKMVKAMALVLCAILLVVGSVMGTLAYLQAQTATISNVMTVGKVEITLSESVVDIYGKITSGEIKATKDGVAGGTNSYKLVPNGEYVKDPKVNVLSNSEACYLFVKVENGIADIEHTSNTIASQIKANGWTLLEDNIYYQKVDAATAAAGKSYPVFETFKVSSAVNATTLAQYASKTIDITAYAVQAEGFADASAAWNATFGA